MKDSILQSVLEVRNRDDYRRIVVRFARQLRFDTVTAMLVIDRRGADTEFLVVENAPEVTSITQTTSAKVKATR